MVIFSKRSRRSIFRSGYTLTEMIIAMLIIALILGIATPIVYNLAKNLPAEAKLTSVSQKLFFLLSDARREGFNGNSIVCIKYEDREFLAFIDNDFDGQTDKKDNNGKEEYIARFDFRDSDYSGMIFKFNGSEVTRITDLYTIDGIFVKHLSGSNFDVSYSNCTFEFSLQGKSVFVKIEDSYPKIIEK